MSMLRLAEEKEGELHALSVASSFASGFRNYPATGSSARQ
jgi:hypothetical protein